MTVADATPDFEQGDRSDRAFLGHPKGLGYLSFVEACERFSYYSMQTLLTLYMVNYLLTPDRMAGVAALDWLTRHPDQNLVMNCGYGKGLSVLEVLDAVDRHTNLPLKRVMEGRRAGDPPELVAGNAKLRGTLDWQPHYADIDRIVADAINWERKLA